MWTNFVQIYYDHFQQSYKTTYLFSLSFSLLLISYLVHEVSFICLYSLLFLRQIIFFFKIFLCIAFNWSYTHLTEVQIVIITISLTASNKHTVQIKSQISKLYSVFHMDFLASNTVPIINTNHLKFAHTNLLQMY